MEKDELQEYLDALGRNDCYRVDAVLKDAPVERTERVFFTGTNGSELGPFIRKTILNGSGQGSVYEKLFRAQQDGKRFAHLPRLFECYQTGTSLVVVMEFVHGATLQEFAESRGASRELVREVFPALCDAVSELHESFDPPVIHRDLTPANIIVSSGDVTLIDLGIARTFSPGATRDTTFLGTREFASPEQYGFRQTDIRSDVFSLGKVLDYCLGGEPFDLDATGLSDTDATRMGWVIDQATEMEPDMRFQTVADLKQAFLDALDPKLRWGSTSSVKAALQQPAEQSTAEPPAPGSSAPAPVAGLSATAATAECSARDLPAPDETARVDTSVSRSTPGAAAVEAAPPTDRAGSLKGLFARIPRSVGIAWDVFVAVFWMLMIAAGISLIVEPDGTFASYPIWYRTLQVFGIALLPITAVSYYLLDLRSIRDRFPKARLLSRRKTWYFLPAFIIVCWFLVAIIGAATGLLQPST